MSLRKPAVYVARKLRRTMSPPGVAHWSQLRACKLGFKVRRKHPIGPYVADFFVRDVALVIEIDGSPHDYGDRPERDSVRDAYLRERGCRVLRVLASDVNSDLDAVLMLIAERVKNPLHHPADGPPPHAGEDF
ncbi:DUF559 domain-containing protein [Sphingomonas sp.]|uniref:endonuclease domain-containing protein n=1 Tax=Sphingomonas sp. TaxID=28214 RepID=UPI00286C2680|nr:DUF559 domain-containing protein [Sphingomonas sp.]